jgi:hypothetical protein
VEDEFGRGARAEFAGAGGVGRPADALDDVALAAAVRSDDGVHAGVEFDADAFAEALEAADGDAPDAEAHASPPSSSRFASW